MKIQFDGVCLDFGSHTGPNTFAKSLARGLYQSGYEIDVSNEDVSLVFIEPSNTKKLANKIVQRLDGIWFSPKQFQTHNVGIKALYERADVVVWQSEFDKQMTTKWFGHPKRGYVIRNGTDVKPVTQFTAQNLHKIRSSHHKVFICSASWHGQKRLIQNVELFMHLREIYDQERCCLIVLGQPDWMTSDPDIYWLGHQPLETCIEAYSMADWMIHLAWCDHSPNTVVHALSQNTPVICSEIGGTKELVENYGIVLTEQPYNFELSDYDNPPPIDVTQLLKLPEKSTLGQHHDISIERVVKDYVNIFESCVTHE